MFFGVPWHPQHVGKYRYFPCVHGLFVDLDKVGVTALDLRPTHSDTDLHLDIETLGQRYQSGGWIRCLTWLCNAARIRTRRAYYFDTGSRLYHAFADRPGVRYECVVAVDRELRRRRRQQTLPRRILEELLPDELCFIPKRAESYTRRACGSTDTSGTRRHIGRNSCGGTRHCAFTCAPTSGVRSGTGRQNFVP
jgi:hypothetical protein